MSKELFLIILFSFIAVISIVALLFVGFSAIYGLNVMKAIKWGAVVGAGIWLWWAVLIYYLTTRGV